MEFGTHEPSTSPACASCSILMGSECPIYEPSLRFLLAALPLCSSSSSSLGLTVEAAEEPVAEKEKADVVEATRAVASTASPPAAAEPVAEEPVEEKIA